MCFHLMLMHEPFSPNCNHSSQALILNLVYGLAENLIEMSKHMYANSILQRCLQLGSIRNASFIIFELTPHIFFLLTHPYGNYVRRCTWGGKRSGGDRSTDLTRRCRYGGDSGGLWGSSGLSSVTMKIWLTFKLWRCKAKTVWRRKIWRLVICRGGVI